MLGKGEDLSQRTDDSDLAPAAIGARKDIDPIDERPDDLNCLWPGPLVCQEGLKVLDLLPIQVRNVWLYLDLGA